MVPGRFFRPSQAFYEIKFFHHGGTMSDTTPVTITGATTYQ